MKKRWIVVFSWGLMGAACPSGQPTPTPPDQPGDCRGHAADTQTVEVGVGVSAFAVAPADAENEIQSGSQGGHHIWTAIRATGFDPKHVTITLTAVDAFSGQSLGQGFVSDTPLNAEPGASDETCDFYGIPLFLSGYLSFTSDHGYTEGLALVTAKVSDSVGHTATGSAQLWLGAPVPACVPEIGVTPTVVPAVFMNGQENVLSEGSTLALSGSNNFALDFITQGLASSSLTATVKLIDPNASAESDPLASVSITPMDQSPTFETTEAGCVIRPFEALPIPSNAPQTLIVDITADDGHGQTAHVAHHITFTK